MKQKRLNQVCNLLFQFLYLYKYQLIFVRVVLKFLELFGLTLNTVSIDTQVLGLVVLKFLKVLLSSTLLFVSHFFYIFFLLSFICLSIFYFIFLIKHGFILFTL